MLSYGDRVCVCVGGGKLSLSWGREGMGGGEQKRC